jgi:hypothetical protein
MEVNGSPQTKYVGKQLPLLPDNPWPRPVNFTMPYLTKSYLPLHSFRCASYQKLQNIFPKNIKTLERNKE